MRPTLEENSMRKPWSEKGKNSRWSKPNARLNRESVFKRKNNWEWKNHSDETCWKNSLNRTDFSTWPNKRGELNNRNTNVKWRECGLKDCKPTDSRKRKSSKSIEKSHRKKIGKLRSSEDRRRDFSGSTFQIYKDFYRKSLRRLAELLTSWAVLVCPTSSGFDHDLNIDFDTEWLHNE